MCLSQIIFINLNFFLIQDDEVIEWNGRSLMGATADEAGDIITEARHEAQVELIVRRPYSRYQCSKLL